KVLVNQTYYAEVSATARRDTEKSYLAECLQSATWLVRALDQRARTILKVANEIVRQQVHGDEPRHLRVEILLHLGDRRLAWRRGAFRGSGAPPHQAIDRYRNRR